MGVVWYTSIIQKLNGDSGKTLLRAAEILAGLAASFASLGHSTRATEESRFLLQLEYTLKVRLLQSYSPQLLIATKMLKLTSNLQAQTSY